MTHQVIPRKYRPKTFEDLVGQATIARCFLSMVQREALPHAILLCGTRGVGKTSTARIFAKALLCQHRQPSGNPCGVCDICKHVETNTHLDVLEIDGASNNGVDAVRELRETAYYLPTQGKHKIYIIDEVHMLSTNAFNALLKILEEPPGHLIFVFATTDPGQLPATILSRVMRFDFYPIKTQDLAAHLEFIVKQENRQITPLALNKLAALGNGSMRDAQMLLEQVLATFDASTLIDLPDLSQLFSLINPDLSTTLLMHIGNEDTTQALQLLNSMFKDGHDPYAVALELQRFLRYVLLTHEAPAVLAEELSYAPKLIQSLKKLATLPGLSSNAVLVISQCLLKTMQIMRQADHPPWVLEACVLQISKISFWMPGVQLAKVLSGPERLAKPLGDPQTNPSFAQYILSKDPMLYGLIQSCAITVSADRIEISKTNNAFTFEKLKDARNLKRLEHLCQNSPFANKKIVFLDQQPPASDVTPLTPDLKARRDNLINHPVVKAIQRELNAELIKVVEDQSVVSHPTQED